MWMRFGFSTLIILLSTSGRAAPADASALSLDAEKGWSYIAPYSQVLVDPSREMDFSQVEIAWKEGRFQKEEQTLPNYGFTTYAYWYKFSARNESDTHKVWYLSLESPLIQHVDIYFKGQETKWTQSHTGSLTIPQQRDLKNRFFYLKVPFEPNESKDFYIRLQTEGSSEFRMFFRDLVDIYRLDHDAQFYLGSSMGLLLILAGYYLLLALHSRQTDLLLHGTFLLTLFIFRMSVMGFGFEYLWPNWPSLNGIVIGTSIPLVFLASLANVFYFLPMKNYPKLRRVFQIFLLAAIILLLASPFLPYKSVKIYTWFAFLSTVLMISTCLYSQKAGFRPARFFAYAWSGMTLGAIVLALQKLGLMPVSFFTTYGTELATIALVVLLSLGVSDKINAVNKALHQAQTDALNTQIETNRLQQLAQEADQRALAEQLRLNALKDQFLANTSHELRTPLNGMIGMTEAILLRRHLPAGDQENLQAMLDASLRLSRLVTDILDFSALREGKILGNFRNVDAEKLIRDIVAQLMPQLQNKRIQFQFIFPPEGTWIEANSDQTTKVFSEILSNAIKFTDLGLISIHGRILEHAVEIAVADRGMGIPLEKLKNIESAFEQGDGGASRKQGGTGLGLALASRLMASQEGNLKVHSQVGVGTTVIMSFKKGEKQASVQESATISSILPVALSMPESYSQPMAVGQSHHSPSSPVKRITNSTVLPLPSTFTPLMNKTREKVPPVVLVVDDDSLNLRVLASHLEYRPFSVEFAQSGPEALEKISRLGRVDLILLDVMMPGMTGYEVCRELRKTFEPTDLPILMLTAKNQIQDIADGFAAGANDYIQKPFHYTELHARIDVHLKMSSNAKAMKRFVPEDFIRLLGHEHFADVLLGDAAERRLSILFADIRGFTRAAEFMQTPEVFDYLNHCFAVLGPEIRKAGGFIDKYIGDAIMALFPGEPDDAINSAVAMNKGLQSRNLNYWLGTGIHIGPTMLGTLGESERFEATALSDAVNVASRLEGVAKLLDTRILVSKDLRDALQNPESWHWRYLGPVLLRGRDQPITLYEVIDACPNFDSIVSMIQEFESGVQAFAEGHFKHALLHFQHVLNEVPQDGPSRFYAKKLEGLILDPKSFLGFLDLR